MSVLCGFRPISQLAHFLQTVPELLSVIPHTGPQILDFIEKHNLAYKDGSNAFFPENMDISTSSSTTSVHEDKALSNTATNEGDFSSVNTSSSCKGTLFLLLFLLSSLN